MSPVVFVTNFHPDHNYQPATEYGAVRPITSGNYPVFKTHRLLEEITDAIVESDEQDFLLLSGSSAIAAIAIAVWLTKHHQVNLLLHEKRHGRQGYVPRTIKRTDLLFAVEEARNRKEAGDATRT
jgi:hypothetical protein